MNETKRLDRLHDAMSAHALELAQMLASEPEMDSYKLRKLEQFRDAETEYRTVFEEWTKSMDRGEQ